MEYHRVTSRGLANQGWKDSWDGIRYADGRIAAAPIALCEVQAYVYGAYLARAHFAFEVGDMATYDHYRSKAAALKVAFNRDFWLEDREWFAMGLDADKRPIDSLTSNMGHCLWTGIVDEDKAQAVAERLLRPEMFSGWGVRTLATSMGGYNPVSYHCGSVWPHDTAIVASGLARYGFEEGAQRVVTALLDAAVAQGGRLPELFAGLEPRRDAPPRQLPDLVLAPGVGGGVAAAVPADAAALRSLGALRQDLAGTHGARAVRAAAGGGHSPGRAHVSTSRSATVPWWSRGCPTASSSSAPPGIRRPRPHRSGRPPTSPGRSTPRGAGPPTRSWWRPRGRAAPPSRGRSGRTAAPRWTG